MSAAVFATDTRLRPLTAIRAVRALKANPEDTSQIFVIFRALRGRSGEKIFRRFADSPTGQAILREKRDLLPVLDNFDRALDHADEGDEFHKGVSLIYKQLYDVLQKHGLRPIDESGVAFDPNIHEAVVREENDSVPSHTVVAILQKGYFLHDRLLRPALVKVAVGGPERNVSS